MGAGARRAAGARARGRRAGGFTAEARQAHYKLQASGKRVRGARDTGAVCAAMRDLGVRAG